MHGTTMIVIIVFISVGFGVLGSMHKRHLAFKEKSLNNSQQDNEGKQWQEQVSALEERVQILEKIVTDEGYTIQKEINNL